MPLRHPKQAIAAILGVTAIACGTNGLSTAELNAAAKQRVREALGLAPDAALFAATYVGREGPEGSPVLCGAVEGRRADGSSVTPRRFIAATDPARWVRFDLPRQDGHSGYQFAASWAHLCAGAQDVV